MLTCRHDSRHASSLEQPCSSWALIDLGRIIRCYTCQELAAFGEGQSLLHILSVLVDHEVAVLLIHLHHRQHNTVEARADIGWTARW